MPLNIEPILIEVAYAEPRRAIPELDVELGGDTLEGRVDLVDRQPLAAADLDFSGVDIAHSAVGVFGRRARLDQPLNEGDRIEIYRPLAADPKSTRRARAKQQLRRS